MLDDRISVFERLILRSKAVAVAAPKAAIPTEFRQAFVAPASSGVAAVSLEEDKFLGKSCRDWAYAFWSPVSTAQPAL
jgi:hypothetical protein